MTDTTLTEAEHAVKRHRTPTNQRLPKAPFSRIRPIVRAAVDLNGPATPRRIAEQAGKTAKGQSWSDPWAACRHCGFIEETQEKGKYAVTERGRRFVGDDEADAVAAMQEGLMQTGFGPLIDRFGTGSPNVKAIAGVLVDDHYVPESGGERVASLLVEMASESGLIADDRWNVGAIEQAVERVGDITIAPIEKPSKPTPAPSAPKRETPKRDHPKAHPRTGGGEADGRPFGMSVVLQVDATKLTPAEIKEIARELAGLGEVVSSG